jgi:hypothetical protein
VRRVILLCVLLAALAAALATPFGAIDARASAAADARSLATGR